MVGQAGQAVLEDRAGRARVGADRDFFISYTQADRAWAEWLAWELEAAGYSTMLQAWDMPPGTAFVHVMDHATQTARHTVLVLSPAYLRSTMSEAEWRSGFVADPGGEGRRLLPVRVEACEPKGLLADRTWIDLVGLDEATARARLREDIAAALRGHARPVDRPRFPRTPGQATAVDRPRFPTALPPVWNVPFHRNPAFTGREQILTTMAGGWLGEGRTAAVPQVLQGGAGVGKTALAVEYAYRHRAAFETVWWVRAEEPAALVSDYAELAAAVGLNEAGLRDQQVVAAAARRWFEHNDRWLLIFDNAAGPETDTGLRPPLARSLDLLPRVVHGQVLVTSRDASWEQHAAPLELEPFTPQEALEFLLARSGSSDEQTAAEVGEVLGFLPLALEQAGAYVREARISLADYLERLRRFPALTLAKGHPRDRNPEDTVASTWEVSLEQVRPVPGAVALLEACAFLASDDVPRNLFAQALDPLPNELALLAEDPFALDGAVAALRRYALIKASERALTVHRLLQRIVREGLDPPAAASRAGLVVRLLAAAFPEQGYLDKTVWPDCMQLLSHVLVAAEHAERLAVEPAETSRLLNLTAGYLQGRDRYGEARELVERALALAEGTFGPEHKETGIRLNELGLLLLRTGDPAVARPYLERALAIYSAVLPPDDREVATTLDNLGQALRELGDLPGASRYLNRALAIKKRSVGPDDATVGVTILNLGNVLHDQGDLARARQHHERALAIIGASLGSDHPYVGVTLVCLGVVARDLGDLAGARGYLQRALEVLQATLGPEHPRTQKAAKLTSATAQPTREGKS